jgi:hypothetical protein
MLKNEIKQDDRGVDRCDRSIMLAVPNVTGDDSKGYHNIEAKCGMPIVQRISDRVKGCPRCDKEPPVGNVNPRTTNAAGIKLTPAELKELGMTEDPSLKPSVIQQLIEVSHAVEAKMIEVKKDVVALEIPLAALENADVARMLIEKVIDGLDVLPVSNFKESRRLMVLRDNLLKSLEA